MCSVIVEHMLRHLSALHDPAARETRAHSATLQLVDRFGRRVLGVPTPETRPSGATLFDRLAPPTRLVELVASPRACRTTLAVSLVMEAQRREEPVAWIEPRRGALYPPDLADAGVDLDALAIVRVPDDEHAVPRAAELLLRSGAFGLVVLDMTHTAPRPAASEAWTSRLAALARLHESRVIVLGPRPVTAPALGTLVSLRIETTRHRVDDGRFAIAHHAVRDKSPMPLPDGSTLHRAPLGLR